MAIEKFWVSVPALALTSPGTTDGKITVASTLGFKVKQRVRLFDPSPVIPELHLEIKRVNSSTSLEVGPLGCPIKLRTNVSAYGVTSTLQAFEQPRNTIPLNDIIRATYEEEPTVAWRTTLVDPWGSQYTSANPLPTTATFAGNVNVDLTHLDDVPNLGDVNDSVRIGSGTSGQYLKVNTDGSINANLVSGSGLTEVVKNTYAEIAALAGGGVVTIVSYTVPVGKTSHLLLVEFSGNNIANYTVKKNGTKIAKKRTWYGTDISGEFDFTVEGLPLVAGDVILLEVDNFKTQGPNPADFEGRILIKEVG